ncbi:hypothetical protein [Actinoplanes sp. NPDC051494]|uniref:hypothetical protein n=1 Tax=Actinoplanes sp. NPDC051494 TaxID=3363907 RepID=UPI0037B98C73
MAGPQHAASLVAMNPSWASRVLDADAPAEPERDSRIEDLRLYAPATDPLTRLFPRVRDLGNLVRLTIGPNADRALVAGLDEESIPPSVTTLSVFTGGSATTWPRGLVLPHVAGLRTDGPLMFPAGTFPGLRAVSLKPARNGQNLDAALAAPDLRELHLMTVPTGIFDRIGHLPLTGLGLLGGGLPALDGIETMTGLASLRLHNLRSLRSIAAITALENLEELQIRYCGGIKDIGYVARLPRLRRLQVIGCADIGLAGISDTLAGLDDVQISASS